MLGAFPAFGIHLSDLRALMRCTSCRFAALYFVPFCAGITLASGHDVSLYIVCGAAYWFVYSMAIELTNRLTDQAEDEINRPERTALCLQVGWRRLAVLERATWATIVLSDIAWVANSPSIVLAFLLLCGIAVGLGYSRGPRLARSRYAGLFVLNFVFTGAFVLGWSVVPAATRDAGLSLERLAVFTPVALLAAVFVVTLAGVKDLTDAAGDRRVGYRSPFVDIVRSRRSRCLLALGATPYGCLAVLCAADALPARMLALIAFIPVMGGIVAGALYGRPGREQMVVREAFYHYWLAFAAATLLLFRPSTTLFAAIAAAGCYWLITTRWLHWTAPVTLAEIASLIQTLKPGERRALAELGNCGRST